MINQHAIEYKPSTLANLLLAEFTDHTFREKLKMPDGEAKSIKTKPLHFDESLVKQATVFPNPSQGLVTIVPSLGLDILQVEVSDLSGRQLHTEMVILNRFQMPVLLDMGSFNSGTYMIHLKDNEGKLKETHKLQIQK